MISEHGTLVSVEVGSKVLHGPDNSKLFQFCNSINLFVFLERSACVGYPMQFHPVALGLARHQVRSRRHLSLLWTSMKSQENKGQV